MNYETAREIFDYLYADVNGYNISKSARVAKGLYGNRSLTYGEIDFGGFAEILEAAKIPKTHKVFCDLGSGAGKAVIAASLLADFIQLTGIELLADLYNQSQKILDKFKNVIVPQLDEGFSKKIQFINSDFLESDFEVADVIFIQATCIPDIIVDKLGNRLKYLKAGSVAITVSDFFIQPYFEVYKSQKYQMGWGNATVYFSRKVL